MIFPYKINWDFKELSRDFKIRLVNRGVITINDTSILGWTDTVALLRKVNPELVRYYDLGNDKIIVGNGILFAITNNRLINIAALLKFHGNEIIARGDGYHIYKQFQGPIRKIFGNLPVLKYDITSSLFTPVDYNLEVDPFIKMAELIKLPENEVQIDQLSEIKTMSEWAIEIGQRGTTGKGVWQRF